VDVFASCSFAPITNRDSTPGSVGKKKGACSGGFGGSFGLFRCYDQGGIRLRYIKMTQDGSTWITSRFSRVCHLARGSRVSVIRSPSSRGGVENTSMGTSWVVNADSASRATNSMRHCENKHQKQWLLPSSSACPCIEGRATSWKSSSATLWKNMSEY
jgi:hypothetical protein